MEVLRSSFINVLVIKSEQTTELLLIPGDKIKVQVRTEPGHIEWFSVRPWFSA